MKSISWLFRSVARGSVVLGSGTFWSGAFWSVVATLLFAALSGGLAAQAAAPNFLVVVADDMRADTIRALSGGAARTPVLDRLVGEGMSFSAAYCLGSNSGAVCIPSRAMLLTGRPYFDVDNSLAGVRTLPERLAAAGYETFLAGKWHNGRPSCERSFERGEAVFLGGMTDQFHPVLATLRDHRLGPAVRSDDFSTDAIARAAVRFLAARDRARPFFAWVSFTVPHDPRTPKTDAEPQVTTTPPPPAAAPSWRPSYDRPFARLHDPESHPPPLNFLPQHPFDNGWLTVRDEHLLGWPRTPDEVRREWAAYHGLISHLDAGVGSVMDALEAAGDAENTYVVFLSDHGLALGSHGLLGKQNLYEHSMRAPFIVRGPAVPRGRSSDALVYLHDLQATVLDLAGLTVDPPATDTHSRSLVPLWQSAGTNASAPSPAPRQRLLLAFTDTMRAVRTDRWKLIRYPQVDVTQLFDLQTDPHERTNLAEREPARVSEMRRVLEEAQAAAGDALPWSAATIRPARVDLRGHPRDPYASRPWDAPAR